MDDIQQLDVFMSREWLAHNEYIIYCGQTACKLAGIEYIDWYGVVAALSDETTHETLRLNGYDVSDDFYFDLHSALVIDELRTLFELEELANGC